MPSRRDILAGMGATAAGLMTAQENSTEEEEKWPDTIFRDTSSNDSGKPSDDAIITEEPEEIDTYPIIGDIRREVAEDYDINQNVHAVAEFNSEEHSESDLPSGEQTAYILGLEGPEGVDLYADAVADNSHDTVTSRQYNVYREFRDLARIVAEHGQKLENKDQLPHGGRLTAYIGFTGRNNSFLPLTASAGAHTTHDVNKKVQGIISDLEDKATDDGLLQYQKEVMNLIGLPDVYAEENKLFVVEDKDGPNSSVGYGGGFEFDGEEAALVETRHQDSGRTAIIEYLDDERSGILDTADTIEYLTAGDTFELGDYELEVSHVVPESGYVELTYEELEDDSQEDESQENEPEGPDHPFDVPGIIRGFRGINDQLESQGEEETEDEEYLGPFPQAEYGR